MKTSVVKFVRKTILFLAFFMGFYHNQAQDMYLTDNFVQKNEQTFSIHARSIKKFSLENLSVGVYGGINFTQLFPFQRSSIFNGNDFPDKEYLPFYKNIGSQMGFMFNYNFNKNITIGLHPLLADYSYGYRNAYNWAGRTNLSYVADYKHKLSFFEIPLILGFYTNYRNWKPYYMAGVYYGRLKNVNSAISISETSTNLSGTNQVLSYANTFNATDQYAKNQFGSIAGLGLAYVGGGIKLGIDASLRFLFTDLHTTASRYGNNVVVSGSYDLPDKFKFANLAISFNIQVPMVCKNQSSMGPSLFCE
jgi:hypothetical protein